MPTYEALLADAARLPVEDRIRLMDGIWDTLPDEPLPPLSEVGRGGSAALCRV